MQKKKILAVFTMTIVISGCCNVPTPAPHPALTFPALSKLPKLTREMLDCGVHSPETLPLCRKIKEREAVLVDDLETRAAILEAHNEALKDE
jgi:hypothetical protein